MNINEKTWDAINLLMEKSLWGTNSSSDSLVTDLKNEVEEFIYGFMQNDNNNSLEEAADVIMIVLCMLYKKKYKDNDFKLDDVMQLIIDKLHRRYGHLYINNETLCELNEEEDRWNEAKHIESNIQFMFCNNEECKCYGKVGGENIKCVDGRYICSECDRPIKITKNSTLFNNRKNKKQYIRQVSEYILQFVRGNLSAPEIFRNDQPKAYEALCKDILISDEIKHVFINYISEKYNIPKEEVNAFLYNMGSNEELMKDDNDLLDYVEKIDDYAINHYPVGKAKKIRNQLCGLTMDVVKTVDKVAKFSARSWNNQLVHKYLLMYDKDSKDRIIECMTIIHYNDDSVRDLTIELSNMYNCVVGCKFCASGALPESVYELEPIDYVRQLNTCIKESGVNPLDFERFYVSFAGIGEPSVVYKDISRGMRMIHDLYPHVRFNIATFGYNVECFEYWNNNCNYIRTLQIPYYSYDIVRLKKIVSNLPRNYNFTEVLEKAVSYKEDHEECRIKINYIVMMNINDTVEDAKYLCKVLCPYKAFIIVKVAYLNYTLPGKESSLESPGTEKLTSINNIFLENGFKSYVFGTSYNTEIGCGQLIQNHISVNNK